MARHPKYHWLLSLGMFVICIAHELIPSYEMLITLTVNLAWLYEPN